MNLADWLQNLATFTGQAAQKFNSDEASLDISALCQVHVMLVLTAAASQQLMCSAQRWQATCGIVCHYEIGYGTTNDSSGDCKWN